MHDVALRESLADLYEQAPCGYIFTLPDGTLFRVNGTFLAWTGYTREDLVLQRRLKDLISVPGRIFYETQYEPLVQLQGFVNEVAFDLIRKDGSRLPVLINSVRREGTDGGPPLVASIVFDATQRRQYEQELLRARQRVEQLAAIVTHSGDAILSVSADGVVESWNGAAERLFGYGAAQGIGRRAADLFPIMDDDDPAFERLKAKVEAGETVQFDAQARHADGHLIDVSVGVTPHLGLLGDVSMVSLIIRDITERRAVERMKDDLVAIVSHDLRSPLGFIVGVAELMLMREYGEEQRRQLLRTMVDEGQRLGALVDDFLDIQRMEFGAMRVEPVALDARPVLERAVEAAGPDPERPILLDVDVLPAVLSDEKHLQQIVTNLLANARKYSPAGGEVCVSARVVGGMVEVAIRDHGLGLPAEAMPQLFQKFYRVQSADRRNIVGTGLGLAICRRLVEAYGGTIRAESAGPNRGSTFTFSLPVATER